MEFSTHTVSTLTGASYRQLDYWCRTGVMHPENNGLGSGGGRARRWTIDEATVAAVLAEMAALGACTDQWRPVAQFLSMPTGMWPDRILVTADGTISEHPDGTGWLLDLAGIRGDVDAAVGDLART